MEYREAIIKITDLAREDGTTSLIDLADALCQAYNAGVNSRTTERSELKLTRSELEELDADHRRMNFIRKHHVKEKIDETGFWVYCATPVHCGIDAWLDAEIEKEASQ